MAGICHMMKLKVITPEAAVRRRIFGVDNGTVAVLRVNELVDASSPMGAPEVTCIRSETPAWNNRVVPVNRPLPGITSLAVAALFLTGCGPGEGSLTRPPATASATAMALPASADLVEARDGLLTTGVDRIEVWVCSVPLDTQARDYQPSALRLDLRPSGVSSILQKYLPDHFGELSNGAYSPRFVAGQSLAMKRDETPSDCLDRALDASKPDSSAVLAVATAEQRAHSHGGFGAAGAACRSSCSAKVTRRGVYVGASDFHPDWGAVPALDLIEHEIGHMLGWPHSGDLTNWYLSALDVMSNSAAPRDNDPTARHGGATLGVNRLAAGWLPMADVVVATTGATDEKVSLRPSTGASGPRLLVLPIDRFRFLTVELLAASGLNRHLPASGLTITAVDQSPDVCGTPCDPAKRTQQSVVGRPPFTDLLSLTSAIWEQHGWRVRVTDLDSDAATLSVSASAG